MSLPAILDAAAAAHVPVLVWGSPGVGKSAAVRRWAGDRGLPCWTVIASLREPADFGGLPVVAGQAPVRVGDREVATVSFAPPRFAVEAAASGGVIFLDELTTAPPAVQAALLRAVVDRAFGDLELDPARVTLVAAANPADEAAGGWDLAAPLANRFAHYPYPLRAGRVGGGLPRLLGPAAGPALRGAGAAGGALGAGAGAGGGLRPGPAGLLHQLPADEARRGQAWPSPRSWDFLSRLLASATQAGGAPADALPLLGGCVGDGPAVEFAAWVRGLDLPDPEDLLADPESYRHPARGDQAYAVLAAVCQAAIGRLTPERWQAAWRILAQAAGGGRGGRGRHRRPRPGPGAHARPAAAGGAADPLPAPAAGGRAPAQPGGCPARATAPAEAQRRRGGERGPRMEHEAETRLAAATLRLHWERPYLAAALWAVQRVARPGLGTLATDARWRLYYDPATVASWSVEETAGVVYHELAHLVRDHAGRGGAAVVAVAVEPRRRRRDQRRPRWRRASSCPGRRSRRPPSGCRTASWPRRTTGRCWSGRRRSRPPRRARRDGAGRRGGRVGAGRTLCRARSCRGSCRAGRRALRVGRHGPARAVGARRRAGRGDAARRPRARGAGWRRSGGGGADPPAGGPGRAGARARPGDGAGRLGSAGPRRTSPRGWTGAGSSARSCATPWPGWPAPSDYSYQRPGRRQGAFRDVVVPALRQPVPRVAVVVDTSGSMGKADLDRALTEIAGILRSAGQREGVAVLAVDAAVHATRRVFRPEQVRLAGGGGTDMGVGLAAAVRLRPRPEVVVVVTDGYTPWPERAPAGTRVVVALTRAGGRRRPGRAPSSWRRMPGRDAPGAGCATGRRVPASG